MWLLKVFNAIQSKGLWRIGSRSVNRVQSQFAILLPAISMVGTA